MDIGLTGVQSIPDDGGRGEPTAEGGEGVFGFITRLVVSIARRRANSEPRLTMVHSSHDCVPDAHCRDYRRFLR